MKSIDYCENIDSTDLKRLHGGHFVRFRQLVAQHDPLECAAPRGVLGHLPLRLSFGQGYKTNDRRYRPPEHGRERRLEPHKVCEPELRGRSSYKRCCRRAPNQS